MSTQDDDPNEALEPHDERPSKSARKRAAHDAQKLGERLIELSDARLVRLALPDPLVEAIRLARGIRSRPGLARQKQFIGKLMRDVDPAPILEMLDADGRRASLDAGRQRRLEGWRRRLIDEGTPALAELRAQRAGLETAEIERQMERARNLRLSEAERRGAERALFVALRTALADAPE